MLKLQMALTGKEKLKIENFKFTHAQIIAYGITEIATKCGFCRSK